MSVLRDLPQRCLSSGDTGSAVRVQPGDRSERFIELWGERPEWLANRPDRGGIGIWRRPRNASISCCRSACRPVHRVLSKRRDGGDHQLHTELDGTAYVLYPTNPLLPATLPILPG